MKISPQNSFRLSVVFGLSIIVVLGMGLAGIGLWRMAETHQQVEQIVSQNNARLVLIHRMRDALREQQAATRLALNVQESQRQQEELQNAANFDATFEKAQAEFAALPQSEAEQEILARVRTLASRTLPLASEALQPAAKGAGARASSRDVEIEITTVQRQLAAELDRLLDLQQHEAASVVSGTRKDFEFTRLHMLILASFVIGAALMLAPVVIRKANSQADELQQQAMFDGQTQLPNRLLLIDRLRQAVLAARHEKRSFGLLRLDVDHFGAINRKFGRAVGDQVLQYVTACIQTCLNEPDTLARMDGDEFAVLSMSVADLDRAITLAQQIRQSVSQPLEIAGRQLTISASVGIVMFPHHGDDPETLLSAAGEALRLAQSSRRGFRIYSADMKAGTEDRVALVHELRDAITNNELTLHYQPKIDIGADRVSGVEALVRWNHPVNGLMVPEQFIPLAEQVDLIKPLTNWVLDTALHQAREWQQAGVRLPMSVKITAASVEDPAFPKQMAARLERFGVPAASFEIELKETADITQPQQALNCLRQLKELGFPIAIGDFGNGDSSMLFVTEYLVANIKLDKALVTSMAENKGGIMAVRSAVNLGRTLGLNVVAKGVENQDSWNVLRGFGCNAAQGFFMSAPLPPVELVDWLQTSRWGSAVHDA